MVQYVLENSYAQITNITKRIQVHHFAWAEGPRKNNPLLPEKPPRSIWDAAVINESALDSVTRPGNARDKSKSENYFRHISN